MHNRAYYIKDDRILAFGQPLHSDNRRQGLGQDDVHDASTIAEHENENITQDKLSSKISKKIALFLVVTIIPNYKARENASDHVVIGFSFASDWLRK